MSADPVNGEEKQLQLTPQTVVVATIVGAIVGLALFAAGLGFLIYGYWQEEGFNPRTWPFWAGVGGMILGLLGFVVLLNVNQKYGGRDPIVRQTLVTYNFALVVCFLGGIVVVLNLLVAQYGYLIGLRPADWTEEGAYTLSDVTVNHLKKLERPVRVVVLYPMGRRRSQLETLLELYKAVNPRMFDYEVVDYLEQRLKAQELLRRYPDLEGSLPGVLVIYGEGADAQHKVIRDNELFETRATLDPLAGGFTSTEDEFNGENAITSTIRALREARKTKIYFVRGHGELDPDDRDPRSVEGIGILRDELEKQHMEVDTFNLTSQEVPNDADVVVIARPRSEFTTEELQRLRDYLDRKDSDGKPTARLFILVDSPAELRLGVPADLGLNALLKDFQVELGNNLVIDRTAAIGSVYEILVPIPPRQSAHELLKPLSGETVLVAAAREVKTLDDQSTDGGDSNNSSPYKATGLLTTNGRDPLAWAEADYDQSPLAPGGPNDTPGPVTLAVAVEYQNEQGQPTPGSPPSGVPFMIVVGDATLACNVLTGARSTNLYFLLNAVNWLGGRVEDLGIPPKKRKAVVLSVDRGQYVQLIFEPCFALLGAAIVIGGMVWVVRTERIWRAWVPLLMALIWIGLYGGLAAMLIQDRDVVVTTTLRAAALPIIIWIVALGYAMSIGRGRAAGEPALAGE